MYSIAPGTFGSSAGSFAACPDGNIYLARNLSNVVSKIDDPNVVGSGCNYVASAVTLSSGTLCGLGLPNFATCLGTTYSYLPDSPDFTYLNYNCRYNFTGLPTLGSGTSLMGARWDFGDGTISNEIGSLRISTMHRELTMYA